MTAAGSSEADKAAAAAELRASFCQHPFLFSTEHFGVKVLVSGDSCYVLGRPKRKYKVMQQHNEAAFLVLGLSTGYITLIEPSESSPLYGKAYTSNEKPYKFVRNLCAADRVALQAEKAAACEAARAAEAAAEKAAAEAAAGGGGT